MRPASSSSPPFHAGLDPVGLLVRLQVDESLVSKTTTPSASRVHSQLQSAAGVYQRWFDASHAGTGQWRRNHSHPSLDSVTVPRYDATAAVYAYTPWVLPNRGGAWLTWNVTRRRLKHFDRAGRLQLP